MGEYEHNIDARGSFSLPSDYCKLLEGREAFLVPNFDLGGVHVFLAEVTNESVLSYLESHSGLGKVECESISRRLPLTLILEKSGRFSPRNNLSKFLKSFFNFGRSKYLCINGNNNSFFIYDKHSLEIKREITNNTYSSLSSNLCLSPILDEASNFLSNKSQIRGDKNSIEIHDLNYELPYLLDALYSRYVEYDYGNREEISEFCRSIRRKLFSTIESKASQLFLLQPRSFEILVAEVFSELGYQVEITTASRDGGYDIYAKLPFDSNKDILIECKRYTPSNKVSVEIVRQVLGVMYRDQKTSSMIVTTSCFTNGSNKESLSTHYKMELVDFGLLMNLLRKCLIRQSSFHD